MLERSLPSSKPPSASSRPSLLATATGWTTLNSSGQEGAASCEAKAALIARAVDHGAIVLEPHATTPYDSLQFSVLDPEGNHWSFGTYTGVAAT